MHKVVELRKLKKENEKIYGCNAGDIAHGPRDGSMNPFVKFR